MTMSDVRPGHQGQGAANVLATLATSSNSITAGLAQCVQGFVDFASGPPSTPLMVACSGRTVAFGRLNLAAMDGPVRAL